MTWPVFPAEVLAALPDHVTLEQDWQSALRVLLPAVLPVLLFRQLPGKHQQAGGGWMEGAPVGACDLAGWARGGLALQVELKMGGARLRPEQARWRRTCLRWGVLHLVLRYDPARDLPENLRRVARAVRDELAARGVDVAAGGRRRTRG